MKSKNLIIAFIWTFVIIISFTIFWIGADHVRAIGGPYGASFLLFLLALFISIGLFLKE